MPNRRLLVFLGILSLMILVLFAGSAVLVERGVLRVRAHVVVGLSGLVPLVAYLLLSLGYILRVKG